MFENISTLVGYGAVLCGLDSALNETYKGASKVLKKCGVPQNLLNNKLVKNAAKIAAPAAGFYVAARDRNGDNYALLMASSLGLLSTGFGAALDLKNYLFPEENNKQQEQTVSTETVL